MRVQKVVRAVEFDDVALVQHNQHVVVRDGVDPLDDGDDDCQALSLKGQYELVARIGVQRGGEGPWR